ncbi:calmodulin binding protein PICBP [Carya illinoinensis]|uniref:Calmodulin-binding domain-containing protein n=1 Tax=Carya illinoinensis TaxID=32201 RepID=A0A8T1NFC8_CARIL|nr:calmodulin binding protein PICBP [Carya illinoinensis]KAG6630339.1 hypothetical protein CIPAW_13G010900 [Carya illinoinensis]
MVQRKVTNKRRIQADHVKSEKLLANLKPSFQNQDGKSRVADLKRKMKKTRSIKLSDIESLRPSPMRRNVSQLGKPPPLGVPATAAIPQKQQPLIKASDVSPNYMKSTSCFEARKEQSQVSLRNTQTSFESKNISRRSCSSSKPSSASANKPARALTRTSSLKLVRTLTKTPSFKPVRASAKKSSRVVLCEDTNAQRATCASTLKDSKFPAYLMLSPGATESEGTSVMKVCPYTYCSLNGHRHSPLPPLKCFLSARRRLLKTQKSMQMEALSPQRPKLSSEGTEKIDTPKLIFEDKPTHNEDDFGNLAALPFAVEGSVDYFIEIYAKIKHEDTVAGDIEEHNDIMSINDWGDAAVSVYRDEQEVIGSLPDGSPEIEVDFEDKTEQHGDTTSREMDRTESFPGEQVEDADEDFLRIFAQEKTNMGTTFCTDSDEGEWAGSEVTDMEWEEGHLTPSEQDSEADYSIKIDAKSELNVGCSIDQNLNFHNEYVIISDDNVSSCNEVILAAVPRELFAEEESACSEAQYDEGDSELDILSQNLEIHEYSLAFERINCNQMSSNENAFEESKTAEDENGESEKKLISTEIPSAPMEESFAEPSANSEDSHEKSGVEAENLIPETNPQLGDDETNCTSKATDEASNYKQMHTTLQDAGDGIEQKELADDANIMVEVQAFDFSCAYSEADQVSTEVDNDKSHKMALARQPDDTAEDWNSSEHIDGDGLAKETQTNVSDGHSDSSSVVEDQNLEKGQREAKSFKISSSMDDARQSNPGLKKSNSAEECVEEVENMEVEDKSELEAADASKIIDGITSPEIKTTYLPAGSNSTQEFPDSSKSQKWKTRCKRRVNDEKELRKFNPREPNYLPIVPDPEAEKVDLKHQMEDERRNAEEWMLDYHLQQAVTKLAPARKRKVALLVEAFETVMPTSKYETRLRNTAAFVHARPVQACS